MRSEGVYCHKLQKSSLDWVNIGFYHEQRTPGTIGDTDSTDSRVRSVASIDTCGQVIAKSGLYVDVLS